jgi:hypothetical protein
MASYNYPTSDPFDCFSYKYPAASNPFDLLRGDVLTADGQPIPYKPIEIPSDIKQKVDSMYPDWKGLTLTNSDSLTADGQPIPYKLRQSDNALIKKPAETPSVKESNIPKFNEYSSIESIYKAKDCPYKDLPWVVTEKINGTNFSFTTNGEVVVPGKRTSYLGGNSYEIFYNCGSVVSKYMDKVKKAYDVFIAKTGEPCGRFITIYGELFGGGNIPGQTFVRKPIMKENTYIPDLDFRAFDVFVYGYEGFVEPSVVEPSDVESPVSTVSPASTLHKSPSFTSGSPYYLDFNLALEILKEANIPTVVPLFYGTFDECLTFSNSTYNIPSEIPTLYGLPIFPNNIREGNVLKPVQHYTYRQKRVIFKHKAEHASEITAKLTKKQSKDIEESKITDDAKALLKEITKYVNKNRYNAVISKYGQQTKLTDMINYFTEDILKDYRSDTETGDWLGLPSEDEYKVVLKHLKTEVAKMSRLLSNE